MSGTAHETRIEPLGGFWFRAVCSCGWVGQERFHSSETAASLEADFHVESVAARRETTKTKRETKKLRDQVYEAAWAGAMDALAEMKTEEVERLVRFGGIVGTAAIWLLDYRATETEKQRLVASALRESRSAGPEVSDDE